MNSDALIVPFDQDTELVIACDNSGSIGRKALDHVDASYEMVAYFAFRVAFMECAAVGGTAFSVVVQNFNGDQAWQMLINGILQGIDELGIAELPITGSTESNFPLWQSATGITVLGKRSRKPAHVVKPEGELAVAIIGSPLVGDEVIEQNEKVVPLNLFQWCREQEAVLTVVPVGSKGILYELQQLFPNKSLQFSSEVDLKKTSGPATCFVVVYLKVQQHLIKAKAGMLFHKVDVAGGDLSLT